LFVALCSLDGASEQPLLPGRLFAALLCCLDDENHRVKRATAVALYAVNRPNSKVPKQFFSFHAYVLDC